MWLFNSSIGRKVVMSVTGMALILFLTFHMSMNVVALFSAEGYNMICEMLGANWYAVLATMGLAALAVIHIIYAFILTMKNRAARGSERYAVTEKPSKVEWASQNMLVLGLIVLLGLAIHLYDFWAKMMLVDLVGSGDLAHSADGAYWIQYVFSNTGHVVFYLLWLCALWFHLAHGFWSMLQTMGLSGKVWFTRWKVIGIAYVTVLCAGFASVVVWFYIQSLI
ncbi:MAG: succinate dehydrogenase/fumarate reductase cytochrome b subunit [Prevotella sp.]|nr:succinate dehydrogenase/fumarate reductase cytochrome b subunit [Prevotella sp.]